MDINENSRSTAFVSPGLTKYSNQLPVESHTQDLKFCGPKTHSSKRALIGDRDINPLHEVCKLLDIVNSQNVSTLHAHGQESRLYLIKPCIY